MVEQSNQTSHMHLAELKEAKVKSENNLLEKLNQMKTQRDTSNSANVEVQYLAWHYSKSPQTAQIKCGEKCL